MTNGRTNIDRAFPSGAEYKVLNMRNGIGQYDSVLSRANGINAYDIFNSTFFGTTGSAIASYNSVDVFSVTNKLSVKGFNTTKGNFGVTTTNAEFYHDLIGNVANSINSLAGVYSRGLLQFNTASGAETISAGVGHVGNNLTATYMWMSYYNTTLSEGHDSLNGVRIYPDRTAAERAFLNIQNTDFSINITGVKKYNATNHQFRTAGNILSADLETRTLNGTNGSSILSFNSNTQISIPSAKIIFGSAANNPTGTATLVAGTVTVTNTLVTTASIIVPTRTTINASTGLGMPVVVAAAGSFTITSVNNTTVTTQTTDLSSFKFIIFN